ncbi:hypothetical protein [Streptomyces albus]|uniref:hypothetical protein n=1 Tax=Streptomyces albus TaxID=1888 RepID=UPI0006E34AB3|nr:hypothetical protein [Streptomyces albus]
MTAREAASTAPADDDSPELEPVPVPECDVCALLAEDRETARANGHTLTVRSCNAVIAGHPHKRKPDR